MPNLSDAESEKYDFIIIGAGPAGLSAAIYAARRNLSTLVIAREVGGLMVLTHQVENYPGFDNISGYDLMEKMKNQAEKQGVKFSFGEVQRIEKEQQRFIVSSGDGKKFSAGAVLLAFGLSHRRLSIPGEEKFSGKGVTYCATCDGPLYRGKTVAIIGGGNSAFDATLYLADIAKQVYLIHRNDKFRAEAEILEQAHKLKNVEILTNTQLAEVKGDNKVTGIIVYDSNDQAKSKELKVDGVFVEIGYEPNTAWLGDLVKLNSAGEIIVDNAGATSGPGIFAAGDCTNVVFKQIVIAAGEGATAALSAYKYLTKGGIEKWSR